MKAKILVADDSITIQKIVAMSFENENIVVTGVNNGSQAFEQLAEIKPDLVLADTDMPGLTGYELCQKIKESAEHRAIKVVLLTSDFEDFDEGLYLASKADGRISKPFKSDEIIKKVNELLNSPASAVSDEPELLSLSASDILDDADLPEAILLEDDAIVSTIQLSTSDMEAEVSPYEQESAEVSTEGDEDIDFDHLFDESPPTKGEETKQVQSTPVGASDDALLLDSMLGELEGLGLENDMLHELKDDEPVTSAQGMSNNIHSLDEMVRDLEGIKVNQSFPPAGIELSPTGEETLPEDSLLETSEPGVDSIDELDRAFKKLQNAEMFPDTETSEYVAEKVVVESNRKSSKGDTFKDVELEPEDLLEKMAPSAFSRKNEWKPDLINESLAFLSESSRNKKNGKDEIPEHSPKISPELESLEGKYGLTLGDQINAILEKSLKAAIQSEVSGLSDIITRTIREVVRDVTPRIAREIIKEEIEKIRDIENV